MTAAAAIRRALISVSDKTGLADLGRALSGHGIEIVSTGGTARALEDAGCAVRDVAEVTGAGEMLDGRVKTLHPAIHGALLARRGDTAHMDALAARGIAPIDLVVVNLYPVEAALARGADPGEVIGNIDIGGPAMLRAAAKNHDSVTVITDSADHAALIEELAANAGAVTAAFRRRMAAIAFGRTAAYDAAIAGWMADHAGEAPARRRVIAGHLDREMRYGENPHQRAALYRGAPARPGVAGARQIQGKALSHNNIADGDAAVELAAEFPPGGSAACVIVKHANPCGVARAHSPAAAWRAAHRCDPVSAFGGIAALNRPLDAETAREIAAIFTELVIAPGADDAAREVLAAKPNLRLLTLDALPDPAAPGAAIRQVAGGFLAQDRDAAGPPDALRTVTRRAPEPGEMADLLFAWTVAKHVKSNAIVFARDGATVGIGAGQMSRVDSTRIAAMKGADIARAEGLEAAPTAGAAVASDAFFPFPDGIEALAEAGARAVIQPGGAMRDAEVIEAADAAGIAMVLTGRRHFRH